MRRRNGQQARLSFDHDLLNVVIRAAYQATSRAGQLVYQFAYTFGSTAGLSVGAASAEKPYQPIPWGLTLIWPGVKPPAPLKYPLLLRCQKLQELVAKFVV